MYIPWDVSRFRGRRDGEGIDGVCEAIAVAGIFVPTSVARGPHENGTFPVATLKGERENDWKEF